MPVKAALPNCYRDRNGTFYGRYIFTKRSRKLLGFVGRDIRCSLWTKDRREARRKARWFVYQLDWVVECLSEMSSEKPRQQVYQQQTDEFRQRLKCSADDLPVATAMQLAAQVDALMATDKRAQTLRVYADDHEAEARQQLSIADLKAAAITKLAEGRGTAAQRKAEQLTIVQAEVECAKAERLVSLAEIINQRADDLDYKARSLREAIPEIGLSSVVTAQNLAPAPAPAPAPASVLHQERLSAIAESFFEVKRHDIRRDKDFNDMKRKVRRFIELLGDPPACDLNSEMIDDAVMKSKLLPREQGKAAGMTAPAMLKLGLQARSIQTTNNYLNAAKEFLSWAYARQRIGHDYSKVINLFKAQTRQERSNRRSWHLGELQTIFNSYLYRYDGSAVGRKDSREKLGYARFWVPLIGLFTGARLEEICSLRPDNIVEIDGVWCFDMPEFDEDGNPIKKNKSSARLFPVNQRLIEFGLIQYAQGRQENKQPMLFDEVMAEGRWSHAFSKWFNRTFKGRIGLDNDKNETVFHSFRSNVVDEFENAGISEERYSWVTGHSTGGTARNVYANKASSLSPARLNDVVNSVIYRGLDLSHISFDQFCVKYMKSRNSARARPKRNVAPDSR